MNRDKSNALYEKAKNYIPGGVNSPVRAFGSVGDSPRFISHSDGPFLYDIDGKRYIDFTDMVMGLWKKKNMLESYLNKVIICI